TLAKLIENKKIKPIMLVGIENTQRRRDLTGFTEVDTDKEIAPVVGGSEKFRAFIKEELFPEIDKRYKTSNPKSIIGESLAGLFVMETFFLSPEMFDHYMAFDPSLWWNNHYLVRTAKEHLAQMPSTEKRLWFAGSDTEDIAIADFNNDGWLDLVFAAEDDMNHEFYLNQGNGRFKEVKNKFPQFISNAVQAYDFNGDGAIDLIFGNQGQSRLFINDGKGNFTEETESRLPQDENTTTQDIALVDVNHDGNIDIIMGNENGNQLWINRGKGFFTNETAGRFPSSPDMETRKVIIIDVNQDGHPDIYLGGFMSADMILIQN